MLSALLIINFADELMIVFLAGSAPRHKAAIVRRCSLRCQNLSGYEGRHFAVLRGINAVVYKRGSKSDLPARVTQRRSKRRPIACKHCRRRKERKVIGWILTDDRPLITSKEKQLVLRYRSAKRPTKLIALQ